MDGPANRNFQLTFNGHYRILNEEHIFDYNPWDSSSTDGMTWPIPCSEGFYTFKLMPPMPHSCRMICRMHVRRVIRDYYDDDHITLSCTIEDTDKDNITMHHDILILLYTNNVTVDNFDYLYQFHNHRHRASLQMRCINYLARNNKLNCDLLPLHLQRLIGDLKFFYSFPKLSIDELMANV